MLYRRADTLSFSDIHLGLSVVRDDVVYKIIETYSFKRLLLVGDIFEDFNHSAPQPEQIKFIKYLNELIEKRGIQVIWVLGNHDWAIKRYKHMGKIQVVKEYEWKYKGKKYLAIHGHQFDRFFAENKFISYFFGYVYLFFQIVDRKQRIARFLKRWYNGWLRISHRVVFEALKYGQKKGVDEVICGHTHQSMFMEVNGIKCYNVGGFIDIPSTYITIGKNGTKIHEI